MINKFYLKLSELIYYFILLIKNLINFVYFLNFVIKYKLFLFLFSIIDYIIYILTRLNFLNI